MTLYALKGRSLVRCAAAIAMLTLVVSLMPAQAFAHGTHGDNDDDNDNHDNGKVIICHAERNGYAGDKTQSVDQSSIFGRNGHDSHNSGGYNNAGDIIPPFNWTDHNGSHTYNGKNWSEPYISIYNAGCKTTGDVTITKVVEGTTTVDASDFTFKLGNTPVTSGVKKDHVLMGDYTVTETAHQGISTNYTTTYSESCTDGQLTVVPGQSLLCTITNTYNPPAPTTGTLIITKYECPADTQVVRSQNGVGGTVPEACQLESGATFGYVHGDQTDANAPYPELSAPITEAGVTNGSGVLTVPDLASDGRYLVVETDGAGNQLPAQSILGLYCQGDGDTSDTNDNQELTFIPAGQSTNCVAYNKMKEEPQTPVATITATKIVCTDEADLPNWGDGGPDITATTATDWVASHTSCSLEPNWQFEWAHANVADPRHSVTTGSAGAGWTPFDTVTNAQGQATINLTSDDLKGDTSLWVREDLQDGYIPFTWSDNNDNSNPVSAELYCATDVLNYDNWDRIDNVATGKSYNCVAWNVPKTPEPQPQCEMGDNLLQNGSFETPVGSDASGWDVFASGTSGLSWLVSWVSAFVGAPTTANIELHHGVNGWLPSNGNQYAELDSDWGGPSSSQTGEEASTKISQTVTTEPGATYELRYDFSPRPQTGSADNVLNVTAGTTTNTHSADGSALSQTNWTTYTQQFIATSTQSLVAFSDGGTANSLGTLVDNAVLCKVKDAPKVPSVTLSATKVICDSEADLPNGQLTKPISSETAQDWVDQSDGACHLASGWSFEWGAAGAGDGGPATIGHAANYTTFGPTNEDGVATAVVPLANLGGRIETREVLQEGYIPFTNDVNNNQSAEFYCANDAAGYDNWEWIQNPQEGQTYNCVAFNAPTEQAPICEAELNGSGADAVVSFDQGLTLENTAVAGARSSSTAALGDSDWSAGDTTGFVSLGFGGSIVLSFDSYVPDVSGADLHVHEATNGTYPLESADVYVSQDGSTWKLAGTADNTGVNRITDIDFHSTGYSWIKYVKVVDTTATLGQHSGADGFDLDAVVATEQVCEEPAPQPQMCTLHIVSDTQDQSQEADGNAALVAQPYHVSWTAVVNDGAKWIWSMDPITDPVGTTSDTFTKSFTWNGSVDSATLTIAADNSYIAKVNGTTAASDATEFNYLTSTSHDVTSLIQNGTNDLSFNVTNWSMVGGTPKTNPGGLIYDLTITGQNADCDTDGVIPPDNGGTQKYTLTVSTSGEGSGSVTSEDEGIICATNGEENDCSQEYDAGTVVTLTALPDEGSNFDHSWAVGAGTCTASTTPCTVTMNSNINLTAHFDINSDDNTNNGGGGTQQATTRTNGSGGGLGTLANFGVGGGNTVLPPGRVLGAATSVVPVGAPNTGAGGTSQSGLTFEMLLAVLSLLSFMAALLAIRKTA